MKKYFFIAIISSFYNLNAQTEKSSLFSATDYNTISVTIGGEFIINGTFAASPLERLDQFLTRIYNEGRANILATAKDENTLIQAKSEVNNFNFRNIKLKRISSEEIQIDLEKFRLTADFTYNPYLKNDDVIIFQPYNPEIDFIEIGGAVNKPTKFPFVEGDRLSDALLLARGVSLAYEKVITAEITRLSYDGQNEEIVKVNISDDTQLKRGDRIRVIADETQKRDFKILVLGEVNRPGYINVTKGNTTIKQVIEKAGGLTNKASLRNSELLRGDDALKLLRKLSIESKLNEENADITKFNSAIAQPDRWDFNSMYRMINLNLEDTTFFGIDNRLRLLFPESIVNFENIFNENSPDGNTIVYDGDIILIPEEKNFVYVFGQVQNPGYLLFQKGKNYEYYLNAAGGLGEIADEVKIISGKTRNWLDADDNTPIFPGDFVYVTKDVPRGFWYHMGRVGTVAGIVGSIATLVLLFTNFGN
ncbi:MAG: SLBB domain-containing protein [Ignavibacteriales bacterium]|nr:SLBB domain-containing protein [Ignavibacteriales bacterium]